MIFQYELIVLNEDNTVKLQKQYKSIRDMALDSKIAYHNLKSILERKNQKSNKYKNTLVNNMSDFIKINKIVVF